MASLRPSFASSSRTAARSSAADQDPAGGAQAPSIAPPDPGSDGAAAGTSALADRVRAASSATASPTARRRRGPWRGRVGPLEPRWRGRARLRVGRQCRGVWRNSNLRRFAAYPNGRFGTIQRLLDPPAGAWEGTVGEGSAGPALCGLGKSGWRAWGRSAAVVDGGRWRRALYQAVWLPSIRPCAGVLDAIPSDPA